MNQCHRDESKKQTSKCDNTQHLHHCLLKTNKITVAYIETHFVKRKILKQGLDKNSGL